LQTAQEPDVKKLSSHREYFMKLSRYVCCGISVACGRNRRLESKSAELQPTLTAEAPVVLGHFLVFSRKN